MRGGGIRPVRVLRGATPAPPIPSPRPHVSSERGPQSPAGPPSRGTARPSPAPRGPTTPARALPTAGPARDPGWPRMKTTARRGPRESGRAAHAARLRHHAARRKPHAASRGPRPPPPARARSDVMRAPGEPRSAALTRRCRPGEDRSSSPGLAWEPGRGRGPGRRGSAPCKGRSPGRPRMKGDAGPPCFS